MTELTFPFVAIHSGGMYRSVDKKCL